MSNPGLVSLDGSIDAAEDVVGPALQEAWQRHHSFALDLAFRMLGNLSDAEDVAQEAFARMLRVDVRQLEDVRAWLVVVVSRLCLDVLRSARKRHEVPTDPSSGPWEPRFDSAIEDPAERVTLDDGVRLALLVVVERMSPAERVVFVLHDVFGYSFDSISAVVDRSPTACRQLASRARKRLAASDEQPRFVADLVAHHELAQRFIAACAGDDLEALMRALDPAVSGDVAFGAIHRSASGRREVAAGLLARFGPNSGRCLVFHAVHGRTALLAVRGKQVTGMLWLHERDGLVHHIEVVVGRGQLRAVSRAVGADA